MPVPAHPTARPQCPACTMKYTGDELGWKVDVSADYLRSRPSLRGMSQSALAADLSTAEVTSGSAPLLLPPSTLHDAAREGAAEPSGPTGSLQTPAQQPAVSVRTGQPIQEKACPKRPDPSVQDIKAR